MRVRGRISQGTRFNVFRRDNFACRYCGRTSPDVVLHVDHAVSVKDGGSDNEDNLVTSCIDCNYDKSSKSIRLILSSTLKTVEMQPADGFVGMWGHTFTEDKEIQWQFKIIRVLNPDAYVCQLYSWMDGEPTNCETITTTVLINDCKLYADNGQMLVAYEKHCERKQYDNRRGGTRAW